MLLLEFMEHFATEIACEQYLFEQRWPEGFICPKCESAQYVEVVSQQRRNAEERLPLCECKQCGHQASVTAGTIFHKTKTDLRKWFLAVYLTGNDKRGVAATTIQRNIGVSYPTAWSMLKKIRWAMAARNAKYQLAGLVQIDDAFFGGESHGDGKQGRGTDQAPVVVAVELKQGHPGHAFLTLAPDLSKESIEPILEQRLSSGSIWETDGSPTYAACAKRLEPSSHLVTLSSSPKAHETFQWINTIISNAKAFIDGTYHGRVQDKQSYFEEFTYRFNRRTFGHRLVERLLIACATAKPVYASVKT